ncbi:MAG: GNAT family N-acetyltransferase [Rhodanobacteraceae bacterium]|nr:GNAT family N-acetyltransferase [Rhodanobacteraceae bacterium]MBL0039742.1 GNAT family N-acetyltransferase [Xanthomonadales bacterium]MBP6078551.1 GNAT family N-acetyltransferase [Xanthomonadales bacterium]
MAKIESTVTIRRANSIGALKAAFPVMQELRKHLDLDGFLAAVATQRKEGYEIAVLWDGDQVRAVAGYRLMTMLVCGRTMYVDDFVTSSDVRDQGYGKLLFAWLYREAKRLECEVLHLDSGVHRHGAHAFYLGQRMAITSHHFSIDVG